MKKSKLLTSLMALVLVVGLGACNESEDDTTSGDSSTDTGTGGNANTGGDAGDGVFEVVAEGIVIDDDYPTPVDDPPVEHTWSTTATVSTDDEKYHVLVCTDEGCDATKLEVHQAVADDDTYTTATCSVCGATGLNIEGLSYTSNDDGDAYYVSGYDDSWWVEGNDPTDLFIPTQYKGCNVYSVGQRYAATASLSPFYLSTAVRFIGIPNTVKYIGNYGIYAVTSLVECPVPDSVTYIGEGAFQGCYNLLSTNIPYGITSISDYQYNGCSKLSGVTLPSTVTSIGANAFEFCYALTSITFPTGLTSIDEYAFATSGLRSVQIPASLKELPSRCFLQCSDLVTVKLPSTLEVVGPYCFSSCSGLESAVLPASLKTLSEGALAYCENMVSVDIKADLTVINDWTFVRCYGLESVVIPEQVESIGEYAFYRDEALKNVFYMGPSLDSWTNITIGSMNVTEDQTENIFDRATIYCYSSTSSEGCWHYENDVPTLW